MNNKKYSCQIEVRWGDSDRLGHVNNTRFVEYTQEARIHFIREYFNSRGVEAQAMVVRKLDIDFLLPITDDSGPLTAELSVLRVGSTSFTIRHEIRDVKGVLCAVADGVLVGFDLATNGSRVLTDYERQIFTEHLVDVPDNLASL
ncbi:MAG: acyl-CoA thioesterase [Mycobacteriaceae bacterium]